MEHNERRRATERATLTDEISGEVWAWFNRHDAPWSPSDATVNDLAFRIEENILAARELALREEIAGEVERKAQHLNAAEDYGRGGRDGLNAAARIARGGTR